MKDAHVIVVGNPADGFSFIGPFYDADSIEEYSFKLKDEEWWLVDLKNPKEDGENDNIKRINK